MDPRPHPRTDRTKEKTRKICLNGPQPAERKARRASDRATGRPRGRPKRRRMRVRRQHGSRYLRLHSRRAAAILSLEFQNLKRFHFASTHDNAAAAAAAGRGRGTRRTQGPGPLAGRQAGWRPGRQARIASEGRQPRPATGAEQPSFRISEIGDDAKLESGNGTPRHPARARLDPFHGRPEPKGRPTTWHWNRVHRRMIGRKDGEEASLTTSLRRRDAGKVNDFAFSARGSRVRAGLLGRWARNQVERERGDQERKGRGIASLARPQSELVVPPLTHPVWYSR